MNKSIIDGIGNSMRYWANYICSVKRTKIINEGSIKYGISEYLVAKELLNSGRGSLGGPQIEKVEFEKTHNIFTRRRTDLFIEVSEGLDVIGAYFEFKHLKLPITRNEINRYIDDFLRLASLIKQDKQCECFFMLVGNQAEIESFLGTKTSVLKNSNSNNTTDITPKKADYSDIQTCLTSNSINSRKNVKIKDLTYNSNDSTTSHYERFIKEYTYRDSINSEERICASDTLKFKLVYSPQTSINDMMGVYIWQIEV